MNTRKHIAIATLAIAAAAAHTCDATVEPSPAQLHTLEQGIVVIVHFGLNTFTGMEWGYGNTPPEVFDPGETLDASQWVAAAKAGGAKRVIMVCKHHDGFCLWPSALNGDYTVANTPWRGGKGNLVREVADATRAAGLEFAAYISPWDRHRADYATPDYTDYFHGQWREIMALYGPVWEMWLDGANGGSGWYGGADESRSIGDYASYYDYPRLAATLFDHNPLAVIFGYKTPRSMRWPGNERGIVPDVFDMAQDGLFRPAEADTPLRTRWFWHPDDHPKSLRELVRAYISSVGRGGILNLGLAPDTRGLIDDEDFRRLEEFGNWVREFNAFDASGDAVKTFDCIDLSEDLTKGLNVKSWRVLADGREIAKGDRIGFRCLVPVAPVTARDVKLEFVSDAPATVTLALRRIGNIGDNGNIPTSATFGKLCEITSQSTDLGEVREIEGFVYLPPEDQAERILRCDVYVSEDAEGDAWRKAMEGVEFSNILANPIPQRIRFAAPVRARRLRLQPR